MRLRITMTEAEFQNRVRRVCQVLGCSRDLAVDYVQGMGDPPVIEGGKVIIRSPEGYIIARVSSSVLQG